MCPFNVRKVRSPASSFEARSIQESIIDGYQAFANTISNCVQIVRSELVRNQTAMIISTWLKARRVVRGCTYSST